MHASRETISDAGSGDSPGGHPTPDAGGAAAARPSTTSGLRRRFFHQSAGAIVMVGTRCLVLRRASRNEWVLPKGHLEKDESPAEAAIREVREETGLEVRVVAELGDTRYSFGRSAEHRKQVAWFLAEQVGGELHLDPQFDDAALLEEARAATVLTHAADRTLVTRAFAEARARA